MNQTSLIASPVGVLQLTLEKGDLIKINFVHDKTGILNFTPQIKRIVTELEHFFQNPHHLFNIPFALHGTAFQKKVWHALSKIPAGQTKTYGDLAKKLGSSAQAIGNACRANPIPIIIPCHRITRKTDLGGYNGETNGRMLNIKRFLLQHEGVI